MSDLEPATKEMTAHAVAALLTAAKSFSDMSGVTYTGEQVADVLIMMSSVVAMVDEKGQGDE